ncbi:MAG: hypothetical protein ABH859_02845 [Pseudomonadota bacterium]
MVEKVSRPDAPPAYKVQETKETKDDQSRREDSQEQEEGYQKEDAAKWNKFSSPAVTVETIKVPKERIAKVLFGRVVLRSGVSILEGKIIWKDGRQTESALFLLGQTEDYIRLKLYTKGREVPESFWARGPQVEIGIIKRGAITGSWNSRDLSAKPEQTDSLPEDNKATVVILKTLGLIDKNTGKFQLFNLAMYLIGLAAVGMIIYYAVQ